MIRFGKVLTGNYFRRFVDGKLAPFIWVRLKGSWAIRVDHIGIGHTGWPISRKEIVLPL